MDVVSGGMVPGVKSVSKPKLFLAVNNGRDCNPVSVSVLHALRREVADIKDSRSKKVDIKGVVIQIVEADDVVPDLSNAVAFFDCAFGGTFTPAKPKHEAHIPQWAASAAWPILVGSTYPMDTKLVSNVARALLVIFSRNFEASMAQHGWPYGPKPKTLTHRGGLAKRRGFLLAHPVKNPMPGPYQLSASNSQ